MANPQFDPLSGFLGRGLMKQAASESIEKQATPKPAMPIYSLKNDLIDRAKGIVSFDKNRVSYAKKHVEQEKAAQGDEYVTPFKKFFNNRTEELKEGGNNAIDKVVTGGDYITLTGEFIGDAMNYYKSGGKKLPKTSEERLNEIFAQKQVTRNQAEKRALTQQSMDRDFASTFQKELQTDSPAKRLIIENDNKEIVKQISDLKSIIEDTQGSFDFEESAYKSREKYMEVFNNEIVPAMKAIAKEKYKSLDETGSNAAYNKAMKDPKMIALAEQVSDFSTNIQKDSATASLLKYWNEDAGYKTAVAGMAKAFDNIRHVSQIGGIGGYDIVNELKFTKGGQDANAGLVGKSIYSVQKNGYELWDGAPTIIPQVAALVTGMATEKAALTLPGKLESLAAATNSSKIISATNKVLDAGRYVIDKNKTLTVASKELLFDTFLYDTAAQVMMGKGITDEDMNTNMLFNLPINLGIGLMTRNAATLTNTANQFDTATLFDKDGFVGVTPTEVRLIQEGNTDMAELLMLQRAKIGNTTKEPITSVRNITGNEASATSITAAGKSVQDTLDRIIRKEETTNDAYKLSTASKDIVFDPTDIDTFQETVKRFNRQLQINTEVETQIGNAIQGHAPNNFWNTKLRQAEREGLIDMATALDVYKKKNPEYRQAVAMYKAINNPEGFAKSAFNAQGTRFSKLEKQYGEMLRDIYRDSIALEGKLIDGDKLSPVHVFKNGEVKNIQTGETQALTKFFRSVKTSAFQKKVMNETVLDDLMTRPDIAEYFTKKLGTNNKTSDLFAILNRKKLNGLTENEVTLIRASLASEIMEDLVSRGKNATIKAMQNHPVYKIFKKDPDGTYSLALQNTNTEELSKNMSDLMESMTDLELVHHLADIKATDDIITSLKEKGVKDTITEIIAPQPDYVQPIWKGFSEMLMRKQSATPSPTTQMMPKVSKQSATKMIEHLQKAFPNIPIEFGTLPDGVKGIVQPAGGKLIVDPSKMSATTSIHEMGHIWIMHAKAQEKEMYDAMTSMIKESPYYDRIKKEYATQYTQEFQFIDEAIAHAIEDAGARFINREIRKTFMEKVSALFQSVFQISKQATLDDLTDGIINAMFNTKGSPISSKNLAELDILQFSKEDFDKNAYFIRHIIQKISEDDLFIKYAKNAQNISDQEFIFQIINSMITKKATKLFAEKTAKPYTETFSDYMKLIDKDSFTEQYIKSEIAKMETNAILKSIIDDYAKMNTPTKSGTPNKTELAINTQLTKNDEVTATLLLGIPAQGKNTADKMLNVIDKSIMAMARNLKLKRIFPAGRTDNKQTKTSLISEMMNSIKVIKEDDSLTQMQKIKLLNEQSLAISNEFIIRILDKHKAKEPMEFPFNNAGIKTAEELYQMLQIMRMPSFASSKLDMDAFLASNNVKSQLKKFHDIQAKKITTIELNESEKIRLVSQVPVTEIPLTKDTVILTTASKTEGIAYAQFTDTKGQYQTVADFIEEFKSPSSTPTKTYLISSNFFAKSITDPEMERLIDIMRTNRNIYPVNFSVIQDGNTMSVEAQGYNELNKYLSINYSDIDLPEIKFEHAISQRLLSRLSENSANTNTRTELAQIIDGTYQENPNAKAILNKFGVNPSDVPTIHMESVIHGLGDFGKIGEMFRIALRKQLSETKEAPGQINEESFITSDKFIITDKIIDEYMAAIKGSEDLSSIYIGSQSVDDILQTELSSLPLDTYTQEIDDVINYLTELDFDTIKFMSDDDIDLTPKLAGIDYLSTLNKTDYVKERDEIINDLTLSKEKITQDWQSANVDRLDLNTYIKNVGENTSVEAFDNVITLLENNGLSHLEISNIVKTIVDKNPTWQADLFKSNAINYLPSFDSFIVNRITSGIIDSAKLDRQLLEADLKDIYWKIHTATFKNSYPENDRILMLMLESMQKFELLSPVDDVFAILKNLDAEAKQKFHEMINNIYNGDLFKVGLDESTAEIAESKFKEVSRKFLRPTNNKLSESDLNTMNELGGMSDDVSGELVSDTSLTSQSENVYMPIIKDLYKKLASYHNMEAASIYPSAFTLGKVQGKPYYENITNLKMWSANASNKVTVDGKIKTRDNKNIATATPTTIVAPATKTTSASLQNNSTRRKMYEVFNAQSVNTVQRYKETDAFSIMEQMNFASPEELQATLRKQAIKIQTATYDIQEDDLIKALDKEEFDMDKINQINKFYQTNKTNPDIDLIMRQRAMGEYNFLGEYYESTAVKALHPKEDIIKRILAEHAFAKKTGAWDQDATINQDLKTKILTNITNVLELYRLKQKGTYIAKEDYILFSLIAKSGQKRNYYMNTIQNSPVFKTLFNTKAELNTDLLPTLIQIRKEMREEYVDLMQGHNNYNMTGDEGEMEKQLQLLANIENQYSKNIGTEVTQNLEQEFNIAAKALSGERQVDFSRVTANKQMSAETLQSMYATLKGLDAKKIPVPTITEINKRFSNTPEGKNIPLEQNYKKTADYAEAQKDYSTKKTAYQYKRLQEAKDYNTAIWQEKKDFLNLYQKQHPTVDTSALTGNVNLKTNKTSMTDRREITQEINDTYAQSLSDINKSHYFIQKQRDGVEISKWEVMRKDAQNTPKIQAIRKEITILKNKKALNKDTDSITIKKLKESLAKAKPNSPKIKLIQKQITTLIQKKVFNQDTDTLKIQALETLKQNEKNSPQVRSIDRKIANLKSNVILDKDLIESKQASIEELQAAHNTNLYKNKKSENVQKTNIEVIEITSYSELPRRLDGLDPQEEMIYDGDMMAQTAVDDPNLLALIPGISPIPYKSQNVKIHDHTVIFRDLNTNKLYEALAPKDGPMEIIREVEEYLEKPDVINKIDQEFINIAEAALCGIPT